MNKVPTKRNKTEIRTNQSKENLTTGNKEGLRWKNKTVNIVL